MRGLRSEWDCRLETCSLLSILSGNDDDDGVAGCERALLRSSPLCLSLPSTAGDSSPHPHVSHHASHLSFSHFKLTHSAM